MPERASWVRTPPSPPWKGWYIGKSGRLENDYAYQSPLQVQLLSLPPILVEVRSGEGHRYFWIIRESDSGIRHPHCDQFVPCEFWRRGRVVDRARLESEFTVKGDAGSNPAVSAKFDILVS